MVKERARRVEECTAAWAVRGSVAGIGDRRLRNCPPVLLPRVTQEHCVSKKTGKLLRGIPGLVLDEERNGIRHLG